MTAKKPNRAYSRQRLQAAQRRYVLIAAVALVALIGVVALLISLTRGNRDRSTAAVSATPAPTQQLAFETAEAATAAPTPEATRDPNATRTPQERAKTRPTAAAEGYIPVFRQADTTEKICAITVDDCFQAGNFQKIVDKAIEVGGKLTLFPIGENAIRDAQAETLRYAWEHGFEIENHTYTHDGLYRISDSKMAAEVYKQQLALCYVLNVEYQPHFLRPKGGDARNDQRLQMYARQLGYYGIAHWSASGAASNATLAKSLKPGAIFLFHTTDKDWAKLERFIPWVVSKGYKLVTLNEMFGYPANETSALTTPIQGREIPPLEPYERVYVPLKKTTYSWYAYLLQEKLIELGYMKGKPDGVYGSGCAEAVKKYQKDHKMKETGIADPALLTELLGEG